MSRIGKKPVSVPSGVEVKCEDNLVTVKRAQRAHCPDSSRRNWASQLKTAK